MSAATASVEPASAVKTTPTVVGATAKLAAMLEAFMGKSATSKTVMIPAAAGKATPIKPAAIVTTTVEASTIEAGMAKIRVVPRADADEHAVHKPLGPVIAVRRAGVRIIIIITIRANRRWTDVSRANSYANDHPLRAGKRSAKQANAE